MKAAEAKQTLVPIDKCPSCEGKHELPISAYSKQEPWTHWYCCPETGDPVNLTLLLDEEEPLQLQGDLMQWITKAHRSGKYFIAVMHWDDNAPLGQQCPKWFSNSFLPHAEFGGCVKWMKEEMDKIVGPANVPAIKVAKDHNLPRMHMFSDPKKNGE